jgi:hypothetical protein
MIKQKYAVRYSEQKQHYEVYRIATNEIIACFKYQTETNRARAAGLAYATRNDLNRSEAND